MDPRKLAALARKNAAKAAEAQEKARKRQFDDTLPPESDDHKGDAERRRFFKEMREREF